ncbi:hypothetical protein B0H13DRAFT_1891590 [Mycena leptocephala]|nr:hypothetical protein B0H13DRAFT_1891590 [Mycena leptocephala]
MVIPPATSSRRALPPIFRPRPPLQEQLAKDIPAISGIHTSAPSQRDVHTSSVWQIMSTYLLSGSLIFGLILGIMRGGHTTFIRQAISVYFASVGLMFGVQPVI